MSPIFTPEQKACRQKFSEDNLDCLEQTQKLSSVELLQGMKHGSIIMIQRPNKSPCNGNIRGPPTPKKFRVLHSSGKDHGNSFCGTQKVFRFWNSCHTRQPLLETPMLPQWWLYARISYKNAVESCRLMSCFFITVHPLTSHAHACCYKEMWLRRA